MNAIDTSVQIDVLLSFLRRLHATFGGESHVFEVLERDLLGDQSEQIRLEVESRFYESLGRGSNRPARRKTNPAWLLE